MPYSYSELVTVRDLVSFQLLGKGLVPYHFNLEKAQISLQFAGHFMFSAILFCMGVKLGRCH
jgi:hypothetical protein